jgi:hypoxanthine phosphoribosyltransferase
MSVDTDIAKIQFYNHLSFYETDISYTKVKREARFNKAKQWVLKETHNSANRDEIDAHLSKTIDGLLKQPKVFIGWETYNRYVDILAEQIKDKKYDYLMGIPRGGLLLALLLSYKTNIPIITEKIAVKDYNILAVDDIADSGKSIEPFIKIGLDVATIFKHTKCKHTPTYYLHDSDMWIVFPYETEDDKLSAVNCDNIEERRSE